MTADYALLLGITFNLETRGARHGAISAAHGRMRGQADGGTSGCAQSVARTACRRCTSSLRDWRVLDHGKMEVGLAPACRWRLSASAREENTV